MKIENRKIILTWEECHFPWHLVFSETKNNQKEEKEENKQLVNIAHNS